MLGSLACAIGGLLCVASVLASTRANIGMTVVLAKRTKSAGCTLAANPDHRCSPGAYYSGLTKAVICSPSFRTGSVRNVPESEKFAVEREYGLAAKHYGRTLEIDHIVSLELGGSNNIANLYPEEARFKGRLPGYHVKDKLENKLHDLVCAGSLKLRAVQRQIASNWQALYKKVFGVRRMSLRRRVPPQWKNCAHVNARYHHGVGKVGAHDKTTGSLPVTNFKRSNRLFKIAMSYNRGLDRDKDGIACEQA
jgi:Excalibur calcium-binding domain